MLSTVSGRFLIGASGPVPRRRLRRHLLCGGSLAALFVAGSGQAAQARPQFESLMQALRSAAHPSAAGAQVNQAIAASRAAAAGAQALVQGAARFRSLQQTLAAQALQIGAAPAGPVRDGIGAGGLLPAQGAVAGSSLWQNAALPVAGPPGGRVTVTVQQTAPTAILNWNSFNVSANTSLVFKQATSKWVVLNRIVDDPTASPSQILGSITAPGQVYVINQNGVLFGRGVTVDLGALVASTADIPDSSFINTGLYSQNDTQAAFAKAGRAGIIVQAGASITTAAPTSVTDGGGFVLLMGGSVDNAGSISTPGGQVLLAAGQGFILREGVGSDPGADPKATVVGIEPAVIGGGTVANTGILMAQDGDVTMVGAHVVQDGAAISSTGVAQRGTVHLLTDLTDTSASVTLGPGSLTEILPDTSSATAIQSLRSNTPVPTTFALNDSSRLADVPGLSRLEISSGGLVDFGAGAQTLLPGGQIAVLARGSVFAMSGSVLSVAGLDGVTLPGSANLFPVSIEPYNLRDSPVNRDTGDLNSISVMVDARTLLFVPPENGDTSARYYTGGGLLEVGGELGNVGYTIGEYSTAGGTITLNAPTVVAQTGSQFDIAGGSTIYAGGAVPQTYLQAADGQVVNLSLAMDNQVYTGVYKGFVVSQPRWQISNSYIDPLVTPATLQDTGTTVGASGGVLQLASPTAAFTVAFSGTISAGVTAGPLQNSQPVLGRTALLANQTAVPEAGSLLVAPVTGALPPDSVITIGTEDTGIADRLRPRRPLPSRLLDTVVFAAPALDESGLAGITLTTTGRIAVEGPLAVADGGQIGLYAPTIDVTGSLTARGGSIALNDIYTPAQMAPETLTGTRFKPGITLGASVTLDARGVWTNARLDPENPAGEAWVNGGDVSLGSVGFVTLPAGSAIDVSSGGAVSPKGVVTGGAGGSVSILAANNAAGLPPKADALTVRAAISGYGTTGGGTLTIGGGAISIAASPDDGAGLVLTPALFSLGFADYRILSNGDLSIAPGTQLVVTEPVKIALPTAIFVPTGDDPQIPFELQLPPLFLPNPQTHQLTRRAGASLFLSGGPAGGGITGKPIGNLTLGEGASITVDPGRAVSLSATGMETIAGSITARGGTISIVQADAPLDFGREQVWIGPQSRLDVSGIAATALDTTGTPYGTVTPGGTIMLGGGTNLPIVVSAGAVLDANGASAIVALPTPGQSGVIPIPVLVSDGSAGGLIAASSTGGLFLEGTLQAQQGGSDSAGGTLSLSLETPVFNTPGEVSLPNFQRYLQARVITLTQSQRSTAAADDLSGRTVLRAGQAIVSADAIEAGGFGTVSLFARDAIDFQGAVSLAASQAIVLRSEALAGGKEANPVVVSAPYVQLYGPDLIPPVEHLTPPYQGTVAGAAHFPNGAFSTLTIEAGLIDVRGATGIGSAGSTVAIVPRKVDLPGFGLVSLQSSGDVRFLPGTSSLTTVDSLSVTAAQLYPETGATGLLQAGFAIGATGHLSSDTEGATLTIGRLPGAAPPAPISAMGTLQLLAPTVVQGGIVRAPFGEISIGDSFDAPTKAGQVTLTPGSMTSVSADGLDIPYGGTVDGQTYLYDGLPATFNTSGSNGFGSARYGVALSGSAITIDPGAVLDLSGGGLLSGAGFISGRGGSTDTLLSPLLGFNAPAHSVSAPTLGAGDAVYALLPEQRPNPAPIASQDLGGFYGGSLPGIGQTITLGAGVPGLPAGTYALLPAYYAQIPGAFRAELRGASINGTVPVQAEPNGSFIVAATTGVAGTAISNPFPIEAILTPSATVQTYSQYDTESYAAFAVGQPSVALFGAIRPHLPQDASDLTLSFLKGVSFVPSLRNLGTTLDAPAAGGFGAQISVVTSSSTDPTTIGLVIGGSQTVADRNSVVVQAADLDAFGADRIDIGGYFALLMESGKPLAEDYAVSQSVAIAAGALLTAPTIVLESLGAITVQTGAVIDTRGRAGNVLDSSGGLLFNTNSAVYGAPSAFAVGNGDIRFATASQSYARTSGSIIDVAAGATIYTDGTIAAQTPGSLVIAPEAVLGAKILDLSVATVNVGDPAVIAATEPNGLVLSQSILAALLGGNAAQGIPALQELDLTALQSLNFYDGASLNTIDPVTGLSRLKLFVLNTPGIYGAGAQGDVATLTVGTLYWNDALTLTSNGGVVSSVAQTLPFAVAGGPGTGSGTLNVQAQSLILGYGPNDVPYSVQSARGIFGFAQVDLAASQMIEGTGTGSLLFYQTQGPVVADTQGVLGFTGTGGALCITTPLLTGGSGSVLSITAGGPLSLAPTGAAPVVPDQSGATLSLSAASINDGATVVLPGGRLDLTATGSVQLNPTARIDVAGRTEPIFDRAVAAPGGAVNLVSSDGDVTETPGAVIDISGAPGQDAGALSVSAASGTVSLAGLLTTSGPGPASSGSVSIDAGVLSGFTSLNQALTAAGVLGVRNFEIGSGDLTVETTDRVEAHDIGIAVNGGTLTVDGLIDASGTQVGTIALAGGNGLVLTGNAVLEARGSVPVLDSYGQPILSSNRAEIALTAAAGTLVLSPGATLTLDGAGQASGDLELNAPRNAALLGDIAAAAPGPLAISGAATIALSAFRTYTPDGGTITQATLDGINPDSIAFENAALSNTSLQGRIAGLTEFGDIFHLRPGVILQSSASSQGNLTVFGDIDLSGYRYGPNATGSGTGEPGVMVFRAANDLTIAGSISDGFATAPATPDDTGWVRFADSKYLDNQGDAFSPSEPYGQAVTLSTAATLGEGTQFSAADGVLAYALPLTAGNTLNPGVLLPVDVTLAQSVTLPQAWVTPGRIVLSDGTVLQAGATLAAGTRLVAGTVLQAGSALPVSTVIRAVTWPAGSSLAAFDGGDILQISEAITLQAGDRIPGDVAVVLPHAIDEQPYFDTRPQGAGSIVPLGVLLPAGTMSWTLDFVSGADLAAASLQAVQPVAAVAAQNGGTGTGALVLDDVHYGNPAAFAACAEHNFGCSNNWTDTLLPSVIRTGTGGLSLSAGGSIDQVSPFGIYTAGTQAAPVLNAAGSNPYETQEIDPRGLPGAPGYQAVVSAQLAAGYQPYYPTDGGNVSIIAQQDIATFTGPTNLDGWQFAQGGNGVPTAWSVNFGSYVETLAKNGDNPRRNNPPSLAAPVGFGALGGGNVTIQAGRDAGNVLVPSTVPDGINALVGSTGRVTSVSMSGTTVTGGTVVETGGGNIVISVAGLINPLSLSGDTNTAPASILADARGMISVSAGGVGELNTISGGVSGDPRVSTDAGLAESASPGGGLSLELGDSSATVSSRGALVLDGATFLAPNLTLAGTYFSNPINNFTITPDGKLAEVAFSLGQPSTAVTLLSAGGDLAPVSVGATYLYPPILSAAAPYGNIYFPAGDVQPIELAPSSQSTLALLAGRSIYGSVPSGSPEIAQSGAPFSVNGLANPFHPLLISGTNSNATVGGDADYLLFAFEPDTPLGPTHPAGSSPETIYAGTGDIVDLGLGGSFPFFNPTSDETTNWEIGAVPVDIRAGRDIVNSGGVVVNDYAGDVSSVVAGRDILYANLQVAGPGALLLQAARNVYQADQGTLTSLGSAAADPSVSTGGRGGGASITVLAGVGSGPDWTAFAEQYFNDANRADPAFLLDSPQNQGKVLQTYGAPLLAWLRATYGYTGTQQDALPALLALPATEQASFVLPVYFDELRLSGREETDPTSRFFKSYARGQQAIATLFPLADYQGDITLFGGSGVQTQFGGDITLAAPGGAVSLGIQSATVPPASAGLITFGQGDVDIYAMGNVELGQSRVFTTFGGGITIWSAQGDINAGRGAKSTVVAQPFQLSYSPYDAITLSPAAPTNGAGIATLSEIPGTAPGDVDLIAPVGTIDAGEAGIRASGNANLAARIILNAANIQVQGKTTGVPTIVSTSTAAESAASSAAGAAAQTAAALPRQPPPPQPSIIDVEVLSIDPDDPRRHKGGA